MTIRTKAGKIMKGTVALVGILVLGGCSDLLVDGRTLDIEASRRVDGTVYLDLNGNDIFDDTDALLPGVRIRLLTASRNAIVDTVTSGLRGVFAFPSAPIGDYQLGVDPASLGDSLIIVGLHSGPFTVLSDNFSNFAVGVGFPEYAPLEVRSLPTGIRVFTRGVVLNTRVTPGDGVVHIWEGNNYLRITQVPPTGLNVGDSVRVQGRTARSAGQPVLEAIPNAPTIINLGASDQLILPIQLSTLNAAQASGGTLDAALVRISNAAILAAVPNAAGHLVVTVDDGTGPVEVVLRNFLGLSVGGINPGTTQFSSAVGLLVPVQDGLGAVRWQMTPRGQGDLTVAVIGGG